MSVLSVNPVRLLLFCAAFQKSCWLKKEINLPLVMSQREASPRLAATRTASQASASVSVPLLKTSERSNGASVLAAGCNQRAKRFAAFCFPSCDSSRKQRRVSSCLSTPGLSQWRRFSSPASVCFGAPAVQNSDMEW